MIIPAFLVYSQEEFKKRLRLIEGAAPLVQIDIMDGTFVPPTSWADPVVLKKLTTSVTFELHLMVNHPVEMLGAWGDVPHVKHAIAHVETLENPREFIEACRALGWECGLAMNPETSLTSVIPFFDMIDVLLFLGVHPGASGQDFIPTTLTKIEEAATHKKHPLLEIDGGFDKNSLPHLKHAGAQAFVAGSAIFDAPDPKRAFEELQRLEK
ncbi:MAG TPA: hypothetical protein DDW36_02535 [Candidatus Magasanikbacteria bacterium]|nr:hypothetical protein [Candidatus Magasanikbacteria bacterium]